MGQIMSNKDDYLDKYSKKTLADMHKDAYKSLDVEENYNYDDGEIVIHWKPVAKDVGFEKQLAKLKAMKRFNEGR